MAERWRIWSNREIAVLLAIWSDKMIQEQLCRAVRNVVPYRVIAEGLHRQGLLLLSCEQKWMKTGFVPGSTQFCSLGFNLVAYPCEKGSRNKFSLKLGKHGQTHT